jgi:GntR family transcriptional regulator
MYSLSSLQGLEGFFQDVETSGSFPRSKVLNKDFVLASGKIAEALQIPEDSRVLFINRLRFINDIPFLVSRTYLSMSRIPEQFLEEDFVNQSLYALLENKYGYEISYSRRVIEAVLADEKTAKLLTINRGGSLIKTTTISYFSDDQPFEFDIGYHRGDLARFEMHVFRNSDEKIKLLLNQ